MLFLNTSKFELPNLFTYCYSNYLKFHTYDKYENYL